MKPASIIFLFILLFAAELLYAQVPAVEWQKCVGGINGEYGRSIEPTSDGGYIMAGHTEGPDNSDIMGYHGNPAVNDIWVIKLDAAGNIQWQKCLCGSGYEVGADVHQTLDGGYIVAGSTASVDCSIKDNRGALDYWIVKLTAAGDIVWQKTYGGNRDDYAWSVSVAADGGYVVAGLSGSFIGDMTGTHGVIDGWVIKVDGNGVLLWQKSLGGTNNDIIYSAQATNDGGCIVAGYTESDDGDVTANHGNQDCWVVKLTAAGDIQWQQTLGGSALDAALSVQVVPGGGYVIAGYTNSNDGDVSGNHHGVSSITSDYWVVKLGTTGSIQWQKCYGGNKNETAYSIKPVADGGYIVAGVSESTDGDLTCNAGNTDMWLIKINGTGALQWQKSIGGNDNDEARSVHPLTNGEYIVAGFTCSPNMSGYHPHSTAQGTCSDLLAVKLSTPLVANPVVTINPSSGIVCAGSTATFTASARYAGTSPTYRWEKNGITTGSNSAMYSGSNFADNDQITCYVTAGGGCETQHTQASSTVTVQTDNHTIQPYLEISADNTIICECTPITFKAFLAVAGAAPLLQWQVNGKNTGNNTDVFISNSLKDGDIVTCVYTDNLTCVANGSFTSNAIQVKTGTTLLPAVTIATPVNTICPGTSITFNATSLNAGANPAYQWKINGLNAGTNSSSFTASALTDNDKVSCTVTADPGFSCVQPVEAISNVITVTVTDQLEPSVTITTPSNTVCAGSTVLFTAMPQNAGANPSYQWKINGVNSGSNTSTFLVSTLQNNDIISCSIGIDPLFTCALSTGAVSNTVTMEVTPQIDPSLSIASSAMEICAGETISFTAAVSNAGQSPSFTWKLNGVVVGNGTAEYVAGSLQNGDQVVCEVVPGVGACSNSVLLSNLIIPVVNERPVIAIIPQDTTVAAGSQLQLSAVINGSVASYSWSPADKLQNASLLSPFTIPLLNDVTFSLMAEADNGCDAIAATTIKIFRPLYMPNAFTPNADGINDLFRIPPGITLLLKEFSIFDRWGNRVFTTSELTGGWDGTVNGKKSGAGIYVYIIDGADNKGKVFLKGTFALIR